MKSCGVEKLDEARAGLPLAWAVWRGELLAGPAAGQEQNLFSGDWLCKFGECPAQCLSVARSNLFQGK